MASEIDLRDPNAYKRTQVQEPETVGLTAPTGTLTQRALDYVRNNSTVFGLVATQPPEFAADPQVPQTSSGASIVNLLQQYKSIPVFQASQTIHFDPNGNLTNSVGSTVPIAQDVDVSPKLPVEQAVLKASQFVATPAPSEKNATDPFGQPLTPVTVDLTNFVPKTIAAFPELPAQPTVLDAGPFGDEIKANLTWFPVNTGLSLTWQVIITMPNFTGQYRTLVDSGTGEVVYNAQLTHFVAAQGNVYSMNGAEPREMITFPPTWSSYGLTVPADLQSTPPVDWIDTNSTIGNSVNAQLGDSGPSLQGASQDGKIVFNPTDPTGDDQKVLNIFYYSCFMHDYCYLLGFRESDGCYQSNNFGKSTITSHPIDARAYEGPVQATANLSFPTDGSSPIMHMGLVTGVNRHTAFDATVVFHEYTHGVTHKLVGGNMNNQALEGEQSAGMSEGWSDYVACTITGSTVVGAWVVNKPGGIRGYPYDSNFPDNFGALGTGRYTEMHNIGEIWCAALMEMNKNIGVQVGIQLVIDALKLTPANPSFLDGRDAILTTLNDRLAAGQMTSAQHDQTKSGIWMAFAKFGMGPAAKSNGTTLTGIVADFKTPS